MRDFLLAILALGCGFLVFKALEHKEPPPPQIVYVTPPPTPTPTPAKVRATPTPRMRRLSSPGTFYLVEYVSVPTRQGVMGFEPGSLVKFVKADEAAEKLTVTDGKYEVEVSPEQLTNDIDIADLVRRRDQESQRQVMIAQEATHKEYQKAEKQIEIDRARSVASIRSVNPVGARHNVLDEESSPASAFDRAAIRSGFSSYEYSPYYYLRRGNSANRYGGGY